MSAASPTTGRGYQRWGDLVWCGDTNSHRCSVSIPSQLGGNTNSHGFYSADVCLQLNCGRLSNAAGWERMWRFKWGTGRKPLIFSLTSRRQRLICITLLRNLCPDFKRGVLGWAWTGVVDWFLEVYWVYCEACHVNVLPSVCMSAMEQIFLFSPKVNMGHEESIACWGGVRDTKLIWCDLASNLTEVAPCVDSPLRIAKLEDFTKAPNLWPAEPAAFRTAAEADDHMLRCWFVMLMYLETCARRR